MEEYVAKSILKKELNIANLHSGIVSALQNIVDEIPAADVEEVKHAHWEKLANGYGFVCSNCRVREKRSAVFNGTHKFCYKCGAKMDGKENKK